MIENVKQMLSILHKIVRIDRLSSNQWPCMYGVVLVAEIAHPFIHFGYVVADIYVLVVENHCDQIIGSTIIIWSKVSGFINKNA